MTNSFRLIYTQHLFCQVQLCPFAFNDFSINFMIAFRVKKKDENKKKIKEKIKFTCSHILSAQKKKSPIWCE